MQVSYRGVSYKKVHVFSSLLLISVTMLLCPLLILAFILLGLLSSFYIRTSSPVDDNQRLDFNLQLLPSIKIDCHKILHLSSVLFLLLFLLFLQGGGGGG